MYLFPKECIGPSFGVFPDIVVIKREIPGMVNTQTHIGGRLVQGVFIHAAANQYALCQIHTGIGKSRNFYKYVTLTRHKGPQAFGCRGRGFVPL